MAAGQGFKEFVTGEVLTAGDVNGYLMQGVLVFASAAARNAAITSPQEGQFAFTKDTNGLWYYDGAAWVASGATGDIEGVTAGVGISGGGTSGTVTITNSMATAIDAKGDLVAGTGADTFSRLAVGTNGQVLKANSATATGLEWGAAGGGSSFSLINTGGTSLSGSTVVTISGISGMDALKIIIVDASQSTANYSVIVRFNGDTAANYDFAGPQYSAPTSYAASSYSDFSTTAFTRIEIGTMSASTTSRVGGYVDIVGCNSTGFKSFTYAGSGNAASRSGQQATWGGGIYKGTSTISSNTITGAGTFDAGTVYVYGSA